MAGFLVLDFETTGLQAERHEPCQVAALLLDEALGELDAFESLMRPLRPELADPEALAVQGRTLAQLADAPNPAEVFAELARFAARSEAAPIFAGHNSEFDLRFLEEAERRFGVRVARREGKPFDTCLLARLHLQAEGHVADAKLETVAAHYGVSFQAHDAMGDVRATAEVMRRFAAETPELFARAVSGRLLDDLLGEARAAWAGSDFVESCAQFYQARGFLTPKQISALVRTAQKAKARS